MMPPPAPPPRERTNLLARVAPMLVVGMLLLAAPARAQGVRISLLPAQQTVVPGSEFVITVEVPQAGAAFNGFDAVVGYDPAALTFLPLAPTSSQQGCLMTGVCSAACGNTFHSFAAGGDSLEMTSILLCNQITLTGPGQIYRLRFRASNTAQITALTLRNAKFLNAGLYVTPVTATGCRVGIGVSLDVGDGSPAGGLLRLHAQPNPAFGRIALDFSADSPANPELVVMDVLGRTVRRFTYPRVDRGEYRVDWDARDDSGMRLPAGVYLVRLRLGAFTRQTRVTLLR